MIWMLTAFNIIFNVLSIIALMLFIKCAIKYLNKD